MTIATVTTGALHGVTARLIDLTVEVHASPPARPRGRCGCTPGCDCTAPRWLEVAADPPVTGREIAVRVRAALEVAGLEAPPHVTVTAPPGARACAAWDLPIALAVAAAAGLGAPTSFGRDAWPVIAGELGLDGTIRRVRGAYAITEAAAATGRGVMVAREDGALAAAAAAPAGVPVFTPATLGAALTGPACRYTGAPPPARSRDLPIDLADVRGQALARWALEVAAAGDHPLALIGPPGIGKSMLARRFPTILPALDPVEVGEVTRIYNAIGLADRPITDRPFRAPHHTASTAAIMGGGSIVRPGEVSLAHRGALFLDEWPEFQRSTLEAIAHAHRERAVVCGRASGPVTMPAAFLMVAACNPCPCGWAGSSVRECVCSPALVARYRERAAALCPAGRRGFDLTVHVTPMTITEIRNNDPGETSATVRARVEAARDRLARYRAGRQTPDDYYHRSFTVGRVAFTIAALAGRDAPTSDDLEAARALAALAGAGPHLANVPGSPS